MTNIALILGTGLLGEDILHKLPWIRYTESDCYIASRIDPNIHLDDYSEYILRDSYQEIVNSIEELKTISKEFSIIYKSEYFEKTYTPDQITLERWLGISFSYISSFDRRFYDNQKRIDKRNHNQLSDYIARLVEYFRRFFVENKIAVFINTIEDDTVSVVAYYTAKKLGIKILGFIPSRFPIRGMMFCEDFKNICVFNKNDVNFEIIKKLYSKSTIAGKCTQEQNITYWKITSFKQRFYGIIFLIKNQKYRNNVIKHYKYEKFIFKKQSLISEIKKYLVKLSRYIFAKRLLKIPNKTKYFLFPLHYLDDAQITFREPLLEQFNLIANIARTLPEDCFLYVKPHPHYLGTDVNLRDLLKISRLKNVKIVNPITPPLELINDSLGVITVNSTTGFEALIMGIPVISFGHDFYCKDEYCFVIRDLTELSEILLKIINRENRKNTANFVKTAYNNTIWISNSKYKNIFALENEDGKKIAYALNIILKEIVVL